MPYGMCDRIDMLILSRIAVLHTMQYGMRDGMTHN